MRITPEYEAVLRACHAQNPTWGNGHGDRNIAATLECDPQGPILDYGCGKGNLMYTLRANGYVAHGYDPGVAEFSQFPPGPFDTVVCFDVLEHIEPECVQAVIDHIFSLEAPRVFLEIALTLAVKVLPDGRNAHLTVKPAEWWLERLPTPTKVVRSDARRLNLFFQR